MKSNTVSSTHFERVGDTLTQVLPAGWVDPQEEQALTTDIQTQLGALPTTCPDLATYRRIVESLPLLKRAEDKVVTFFKDIKAAAYTAHKTITAKESAQLRPIQDARTRLSQLKYRFEQEQERLTRERERALADVERQRLEDQAIAEAAALEAHAPEMAAQIVAEAIAAPAPTVVLPSVTAGVDVKGVGKSRPRWVWRYLGAADHDTPWASLDPAARLRILALMPREWLAPNEALISAAVKASNGAVKIPGVESFDIGTTAVRG